MGNPSAQDFQRLAQASNNSARALNALTDSIRALNINLVAIHERLKEMNEKDE